MDRLFQKLIVFPGLSSPFNNRHAPIYDLLRNEAKKRDTEIEISQRLLPLRNYSTLEEEQIFCRTVGLSFSCFIPLVAASEMREKRCWEKIVVWGMLLYWKIWTGFGRNIKPEVLALDTRILEPYNEFFRQLVPHEYLITEVDLPVTVGPGSEDKYVDVEFFCYLKSIYKKKGKNLHSFEYIHGCSHTVTIKNMNWQGYIKMIFS